MRGRRPRCHRISAGGGTLPPVPGGHGGGEKPMKRKGLITATVLLFLVGLSLLLYPMASNAWNKQRSDRLIRLYEEKLASAPEADYSAAFDAVDAYNKTLAGRGVPDAFAFIPAEEDALYLSLLNFGGDGLIGYIRIPRISVSLPIYHTTTEAVLVRGVGHLEGSALPVGGAGTHSVLSGHRGLPSAALFTDLNLLETGDHFYIYVLNRTLAYEVDQILEVAPDHTEDLDAVADEDYVTLVTCTPYGVNTHRLLVRGHRVDYEKATAAVESKKTVSSVHTRYGLWAAGGIAFTALFVLVLFMLTRPKHKPAKSKKRSR